MKKSTRRFVSLVLVVCLAMAFALSVSAASDTFNGTYNNQGYQTTSTYRKTYLKASIGSASTYNLKATISYVYHDKELNGSASGSVSSVTKPTSTYVSTGLASPNYYETVTFTYRVNGSVVQNFTRDSIPTT